MDKLQRHFIISGLCLIVLGFVYGFGYTILVDHEALLVLKDNFGSVFVQLAQSMQEKNAGAEIIGSLEELSRTSVHYRRAIGAHTHAINLGLLVILFSVIFAFAYGKTGKGRSMALLFVLGAFAYPLGLALQAVGLVLLGELFAVLGSGAVVCCVAVLLLVLFFAKPNGQA